MKSKKCPVCDWEIKDAVKVKASGNEVVVCCEECAKTVSESPSKYSDKTE